MIWSKDVVFKIAETWGFVHLFIIIIIMFWFCVCVSCVGVKENITCESYVFLMDIRRVLDLNCGCDCVFLKFKIFYLK